jgi:diadenylate cyclase
LDVFLVALLIYQVYKLIRGTAALTIFFGLLGVYLLYFITDYIGLKMLSRILGQFTGVGVLALIVVFQQEIRRFLLVIGKAGLTGHRKLLFKIFKGNVGGEQSELNYVEISLALAKMAEKHTGALIVITERMDFKPYEDTGIALHAELTAELLENIFFKNSPLHDGAVVISQNKVRAARVILPLSENVELVGNYGLRHRAAIGISENADVLVFSVSEQTGQISYTFRGNFYPNITPETARKKMKEYKAHKLR